MIFLFKNIRIFFLKYKFFLSKIKRFFFKKLCKIFDVEEHEFIRMDILKVKSPKELKKELIEFYKEKANPKQQDKLASGGK